MRGQFVWTDKYSVNVEDMDAQHKQFLEICNDLILLSNQENIDKEDALVRVMRLGDYAVYHLGAEEELFKKTVYPDAEAHKKIHDKFRADVKVLIDRIRSGDGDIRNALNEVGVFAMEWLLNHILSTDKQYSKYIN